MKQKSIVIACYASLILIGGIMGYVVAHSLISLVASGLFAIFLFICSIFIWKGNFIAYRAAMLLVFCLVLFFSYRFILTNKWMPAGMMGIMSTLLLIYLMRGKKRILNFLN